MTELYEASRDGFTISTDKARLDRDLVYRFLTEESYWSKGISRSFFERQVAGCLCFGLYDPAGAQIGFAKVGTDYSTLAWLSDVFVLPAYRGRGLSRFIVETVMAHPDLQGMRRWMLATDDAHGLYRKYGFTTPDPSGLMERRDPEAHKREV
jgi:GNAT superfamily N-acetyltransferase